MFSERPDLTGSKRERQRKVIAAEIIVRCGARFINGELDMSWRSSTETSSIKFDPTPRIHTTSRAETSILSHQPNMPRDLAVETHTRSESATIY